MRWKVLLMVVLMVALLGTSVPESVGNDDYSASKGATGVSRNLRCHWGSLSSTEGRGEPVTGSVVWSMLRCVL
jgi:hypothetical protein